MKIYLGTQSKIKLEAVDRFLKKNNFKDYTLAGLIVDSGVSDTPMEDETFVGAKNRADNCANQIIDPSSLYIGLESGLSKYLDNYFEFCVCVCIFEGQYYYGTSSYMMLPKGISEQMDQGKEHANLMKELDKQTGQQIKDTWIYYSQGKLTRSISFEEAIRNAIFAIPTLFNQK